MEAFLENVLTIIRDNSSLIVALVMVVGMIWRVPSKGDINRIEDGLSARMDRLDFKIDDTRNELKAGIKAVEVKVAEVEEKLSETNEHYFELRGDVKALSRDVAALTD